MDLPAVVYPPKSYLYGPSTSSWHSLRGRDEPEPSRLGVKTNDARNASVRITFRQGDKILGTLGSFKTRKPEARTDNEPADPDAMELEEGEMKKDETGKTEKQSGKLKLNWNMHSQIPGFYLSFSRQDEKHLHPVHVHFFVNNFLVTRDDDGTPVSVGVEHSAGDMDHLIKNLDPKAGLEPRSNGGIGMLWATDVEVWRKGCPQNSLENLSSSEPVFRHISKADLDRIKELGDDAIVDGSNFGDPDILSDGEWTIYGLLTCTKFTMYRTWLDIEESNRVYNFFVGYMHDLFFEVATHGNFPFYARQAAEQGTTKIYDHNFIPEEFTPPLPLVTRWRIETANQVPVSATPESWTTFKTLKAYPDAKTKAFAMRLGIERNRASAFAEMEEWFEKCGNKLEAEIWPLSIKSSYFLQMNFAEGDPVPAVDTRLSVEIVDGEFKGHLFEGVVVEDAYGLGMDLCASVYLKKGMQELPSIVMRASVCIQPLNDGIAYASQNAAVVTLAHGTNHLQGTRTQGVDFASLLFESPRTIMKVSSLADEADGSWDARNEFNRTLVSYGLNSMQRAAARFSFTSQSGLTIVWGPPGTGKTHVATAALHAHVNVGRLHGIRKRPILVCAPSHAAVDRNLGALIEALAKSNENVNICRFRGGAYPSNASAERTDDQVDEQALAELKRATDHVAAGDGVPAPAVWEAIDAATRSYQMIGGGMHLEYEFNRKRKDFIESHAKNISSEYHQEAWSFIDLKTEIKTAVGKEKTELCAELKLWEKFWNERFFDTVDVVFCTHLASGHPILSAHYSPKILMIDDYAQESLPTSAIPAAAHLDTLELFWATGDPEQQGPIHPTKGTNEAFWDITRSPFDMLFGDESVRERVQLVAQHRMRPVISSMVSRIWYNGTLEDSPAVQKESLLEKTIKQAYLPLGESWNGRTRFMVDVSGPAAESTKNNNNSLYNRAEGDLIVNIIAYLLSFDPKQEPGTPELPKIQHRDIMVVTSYKGQAQYIKKKLRAKKINTLGTKDVRAVEIRVLTTRSVQGGEAPIVLHSMVRNIKGHATDMGFTRQPSQLCVNFSRAQIHHITVGNVRALWQTKAHGNIEFKKGRPLYTLGLILDDFRAEQDVVSWMSLMNLIKGN